MAFGNINRNAFGKTKPDVDFPVAMSYTERLLNILLYVQFLRTDKRLTGHRQGTKSRKGKGEGFVTVFYIGQHIPVAVVRRQMHRRKCIGFLLTGERTLFLCHLIHIRSEELLTTDERGFTRMN